MSDTIIRDARDVLVVDLATRFVSNPKSVENVLAEIDAKIIASSSIVIDGLSCPASVLVGDAVYISGSMTVDKTLASNPARMPAVGVVYIKPTTITCGVIVTGLLIMPGALTPNMPIWISETTLGLVTQTPPVLNNLYEVQSVGLAISTTVAILNIDMKSVGVLS